MKMTIIRAIAPVVVLTFLMAPLSFAAERPFWDVEELGDDAQAILTLHGNGILQGYEDGSFRPRNLINRAEFLKILVETTINDAYINSCISTHNPTGNQMFFSDVPASAWYAKYVCAGYMQGFVEGYPDGSFKPAQTITLTEAAKIIVLAKKLPRLESEFTAFWYESYLQALTEKGAIPESLLRFDLPIQRAEMAEMLYRVEYGQQHLMDYPISYETQLFYMKSKDPYYSLAEMRKRREEKFSRIQETLNKELKNPDSVYTLTLQGLRDQGDVLLEWPEEIGNFRNLGSLSVFNNSLSDIGPSIGKLSQLGSINAGVNNISSIDPALWTLTNLKYLSLLSNQLTSIPDGIGNLTQLETLYLNNNQLTTLPDSIEKLRNLKVINLEGNPISDQEMARIRSLLPATTIVRPHSSTSLSSLSPTSTWTTFTAGESTIHYPFTWSVRKNVKNATAVFTSNSKEIAWLYCPIPQVGFEAWEFEEKTETFTKNGKTHGKTLWIGHERPGTDVGDYFILFLHRNDFDHWYEEADADHSCMLTMSSDEAIIREMFRRSFQ